MFEWGIFRESKNFYTGIFGLSYRFDHDHHHVHISSKDLGSYMRILRFDMGFQLLNDIVVTSIKDHPHFKQLHPDAHWDVTYHLFHMETHQRMQLHLLLVPGETLPEVDEWYPGARYFETQAKIKLGYTSAQTAPIGIPAFRTNPNLSEPPFPEELHQWYFFDVNHPVTRKQWALVVESMEGKILNSTPQTGYWTRGFEAKARELDVLQLQPLLDGLIPQAAPMVNLAWMKTVEDYFLWNIPERAQAVRMLFMEMSRMNSHLSILGELSQALQLPDAARICREMIERSRRLQQFYSGARVATSLGSLGGLSHDLPAGWVAEMVSFMRALEKAMVMYRRLVINNPLVRKNLKSAGISAQEALQLGITGPALRAAGVNFDLRKSRPFYFYQDIDFDIPVGMGGDSHDRVLIYIEECHQSLRILWQVIDNLPLGAIALDVPGLEAFNHHRMELAQWREWWIAADRSWSAQYTGIEGPQGELGFHLTLSPDQFKIWWLQIKTNGGPLIQGLPVILKDCPLMDLKAALITLNIEASTVDK